MPCVDLDYILLRFLLGKAVSDSKTPSFLPSLSFQRTQNNKLGTVPQPNSLMSKIPAH